MREIPLTGRHGAGQTTLVDDEDFERFGDLSWHHGCGGYACRRIRITPGRKGKQYTTLLHREIMGLSPRDGLEVDHINGNGLDNRRENLRVVTHGQNQQNRVSGYGISRFRGVSWDTRTQKWRATAQINGRQKDAGYFTDELEAARVAAEIRAEGMPFSREAA